MSRLSTYLYQAAKKIAEVATGNPFPVNIISGGGGGSSGTEYTEGATDASITGTAILMEGAGDALLPVPGTTTDGLLVNLGANNDVSVTGVVAVTQSGTWDEVGINDSGNSITVDAPVATPVFVRLSDGASAISTLPVSVSSIPSHNVTNAGTFSVQSTLQSGSAIAGQFGIDQTTPGATDSVTIKASSGIGSLTETAPASDTASSGLNGRLQRIAQRLTSLIGLLPTALGQTTMSASLPVTLASNQSALPITDNSGSLTVDAPVGTPVFVRLSDGASAISTLPVSLASVPSHAVTNAGTFAVQAASAGDVAHDAVDSGNPIKIGGQARTTNPTAVADADRVNAMFDKVGRHVTILGHVRELTGSQNTTITSSTAETTIVTAGGAGVFNDIVKLVFTNSSATASTVTLKDSTGGTTRAVWRVLANSALDIPFFVPLAQGSANANWTLTCGTSVASIIVMAQFVKNV